MAVFLTVCLVVTVLVIGYLASLFWTDPERGLRETTHHARLLPSVMADRYLAYAVLGVGMIFLGSPGIIAVYFLAGAIMGLGDGYIYARADLPHLRHTASGLASLGAMLIALVVAASGG